MTEPPLNTVSLRLRVTAAVIIVLAAVLILLGVAVNATFVAQSNRNLDALLTGRVQLARQLARSGVGPQALVNRVDAEGVRAHLVLRNGQEFGTPPAPGAQIMTTTITLNAPTRVDGAELTLAVDTSLVSSARANLRRVLIIASVTALVLSALLITLAVRLALRPLDAMAELAKGIAGGRRGSPAGADPYRHRAGPDGPGLRRDAGRARGSGDSGPGRPRSAPGHSSPTPRTSCGRRSPAYRRPRRPCCITMINSTMINGSTWRRC